MLPSQMPSHMTSACRVGVGDGLLGRAHVGLGDDLQQRRAGAVQVDARLAVEVLVQALAGVFLQVGAGELHHLLAVTDEERHAAALHHRDLELADLVALGQVRVEVVLAGEDGQRRHLGAHGQAEADGPLHRGAVQHRQRAGQGQVHRAGLGVGLGAEGGRGAAEDLGLRGELDVVFQADHDLVATHELGLAAHLRNPPGCGGDGRSPAAARAACSRVPSWK
jgi:hypothetical protein